MALVWILTYVINPFPTLTYSFYSVYFSLSVWIESNYFIIVFVWKFRDRVNSLLKKTYSFFNKYYGVPPNFILDIVLSIEDKRWLKHICGRNKQSSSSLKLYNQLRFSSIVIGILVVEKKKSHMSNLNDQSNNNKAEHFWKIKEAWGGHCYYFTCFWFSPYG